MTNQHELASRPTVFCLAKDSTHTPPSTDKRRVPQTRLYRVFPGVMAHLSELGCPTFICVGIEELHVVGFAQMR